MPPRVRMLMFAGLGLALLGIVGLAATIGRGPDEGISPSWFVPLYVAGSLLLLGSGLAWLVHWTRSRPPHSGPGDSPSSTSGHDG